MNMTVDVSDIMMSWDTILIQKMNVSDFSAT